MALSSGGSWLLWINETSGAATLGPLAAARQAAQWAVERKPALGKTTSENLTAVLVSETQWTAIMNNFMLIYPYVNAVRATALSLQDQGFLTDIVNEATLEQGVERYKHLFVPDLPSGPPLLSAKTVELLQTMKARGAVIVTNAPAAPSGYPPDVQRLANASNCIFTLRRSANSSRFIFHVVDLVQSTREGLSVNLPLRIMPTQVQAYPSSVKVAHSWSDGRSTITLGEFNSHAAVVFDVAADTGAQLRSDCNQDGELDISDGICLLGNLFLGEPALLPCGDGGSEDPGNVSLLDSNGDGSVDLSDAVSVFVFLFLGIHRPVLGTDCLPIAGCPANKGCR
jgi:hypothetical protein